MIKLGRWWLASRAELDALQAQGNAKLRQRLTDLARDPETQVRVLAAEWNFRAPTETMQGLSPEHILLKSTERALCMFVAIAAKATT